MAVFDGLASPAPSPMLPPAVTPDRLQQLARIALDVAEEAAALVLPGYRTAPATTEKARHDLVTAYDLRSERLLRRRLRERTPELAVVGEEEGGRALGADLVLRSDRRHHELRTRPPLLLRQCRLMESGVPLLGAVVAPALCTRWHGFVGGGAFRDGLPCKVSPNPALEQALLATGFHPKSQRRAPDDNLGSFGALLPEARGIRRCGSAALDLCMVADGTYDAYWERALNAWDAAAGAALVLAAGGRLTDLRGGPPDLTVGHIVASNGHVHGAVLARLPEAESD